MKNVSNGPRDEHRVTRAEHHEIGAGHRKGVEISESRESEQDTGGSAECEAPDDFRERKRWATEHRAEALERGRPCRHGCLRITAGARGLTPDRVIVVADAARASALSH